MKQLFLFVSIVFVLTSFGVKSQCSNWLVDNFDSFEYTTPCPYLIPGSVYHLNPQNSGFGPNHSGNTHLYLNFQNGFTGVALSRPYNVCIGNSYQISFYHRDAWGGANNTTFNFYDANNVLLYSQNVPWTGTAWNYFVSPTFVAATNVITLEVVNNQTTGNNDMVIDDMTLSVCGFSETTSFMFCNQTTPVDLLSLFSSSMPTGGAWSGPSALANGDLGTFDPNTNTYGIYTYNPPNQSCIAGSEVTVTGSTPIDLGNDTTLCSGASITLNAGPGFDSYAWSNGATTQTITVSQAGTYSVEGGILMGNIIQHGDFQGGTTASSNSFTTGYVAGTGGAWGLLSAPGQYAISTSPNLVHNNFAACGDHTTGSGNMFIANGSSVAGTVVWSQTVPVSANTDYLFSFWAMNAVNDPNVSNLQLYVNGIAIGPINSTTATACNWLQISDVWNSGASTSATISIINQSTASGGNDFAIDDIVFAPLCLVTDTVVVSIETPAQTITKVNPSCSGLSDAEIHIDNALAVEYSFDNGVSWQVDSFLLNLPAGNYTVCSRSALGCSICSQVSLVNPVPVTVTASADTTICENGTALISASATGGTTYDYHWDFTADTGNQQSVSPTSATWYYVQAENQNGCFSPLDSVLVSLYAPLNGDISQGVSVCPGFDATIDVLVNGGVSPYTFTWSSGQVNTSNGADQLIVSPPATTNYTVTIADACETTPLVLNTLITVLELPVPTFQILSDNQCEPAVFELENTTDPTMSQYVTWIIDGNEFFVNQDVITTQAYMAGSYDVQMIVTSFDGCIDSATFNNALYVYPKPHAMFTYSPSPVTMFNTQVFFNNGSTGASTYEWTFEEGEPLVSTLQTPNVVFPDGEVGIYETMLIAISDFGCADTAWLDVQVYPEVILFAPNAFTPDGDEFNQGWRVYIEGVDIYDFDLEIFNRWGEIVWESHDPNQAWDGTLNGTPVPTGTYTWKIEASDLLNDGKYTFNGHVNVLR